MKLFRFLLLCTFAIYLLALLQLPSEGVSALEAKQQGKQQASGVGKVKCKEEVDKALRQYFDKDDDDNDSDDNDDEDDDDDDNSKEANNTKEDDDDDDDEEEGEGKNDSGDDDDDSDEKVKRAASDDDDDDDGSKESAGKDDDDDDSDEKSEEKSKDNDDDDDDDDDSKEVAGNAAKVRPKKDAAPPPKDDDDDDDDDDSEEEEEKVPAAKSSSSTPAKGASAAPAGNKKVEAAKEESSSSKSSKASKSAPKPAKAAPKKVEKEEKDSDEDEEEEEEVSEEELAKQQHQQKRSRAHIDDVLKVYEIGSQDDNQEQNLILSIFRDLKRIYEQTVKPLETIYKYRQITTRLITDAEIFSKPMVLFLGGKSTGKSSLVNYLLGIDETPWEIKIGAASSGKFTILSYGDNYTRLSATELSADYTFSSLQRFGEQFINEYIDAHRLPINILQKMTIVDSPGLIDLLPAKAANKQTIDNDVYQWFIDRSDVIYIVIDVSQLHLSSSLRVLLDQLKGREVRFVISKSDIASQSQIISMIGQLLWVLSPIMSAEQPPMVYALTTLPADSHFDEFLDSQETGWLRDLSYELSGISRIESHIAEVRRHAVRVRNHAKLVDCYLATFYRNKGLFTFGASSRQLAVDISENPHQYRIYSGAIIGQLQNVSRYDLPDPGVYRDFFRTNPLIDFKPLSSTCSYFRGCPIDKLDVAIAYDLPELVGKYKKLTKAKLDTN